MKIEVSAKTIEKAVEDGLKQLNTTIENVDVKVISEGGLFKKAKIEMTLNTDPEKQKELEELEKDEIVSTPANDEDAQVVVEADVEEKDTAKVVEDIAKHSENITNTMTAEEKQARKEELIAETVKLATEWLNGLIYAYNINATVLVTPREHDVYANIDGENLGVLIGYHGEAMEAIQHLLNTHLYNKCRGAKRVFVDVAGYRNKRSEDLKELARKMANRVLETKRSYKLDPMNSFERRIVHEELSQTANILTHSEGEEPNRYLIIEYTEEV